MGYQEVRSMDGKSVPDERIGLHLYGEDCTFEAFRKIAAQQHKERAHRIAGVVMAAADTSMGHRLCEAVQGTGPEVLLSRASTSLSRSSTASSSSSSASSTPPLCGKCQLTQ